MIRLVESTQIGTRQREWTWRGVRLVVGPPGYGWLEVRARGRFYTTYWGRVTRPGDSR